MNIFSGKIILFSLFNVSTLFASAQIFTGSIDVQLAIPQGEYKLNNENIGIGGRFNFLWWPKQDIPVKLGVELAFQSYGNQSENFDVYVYGFNEQYKVSAANNVVGINFMPRVQCSKFHKIKPFVDGLFGWNVFFSSVTVERVTSYSSYNNDSYSNSSKGRWAFNYGGAAGIDIPLDKQDDAGIEIKCAYLFGANTRYLTDPRIDNNGRVYFIEKKSETNMLIPQVGVRLNIN